MDAMLPLNTKACPVTDMQILRWWILAECLQQCALRLQRIERLFLFFSLSFFDRHTLILSLAIRLKLERLTAREGGRGGERQR